MLQHILRMLTKLAFILIISQLLASVRAGVINKRDIMLTTLETPTQTEFVDETKLPTESIVLNQLVEEATPKAAEKLDEVLPTTENLNADIARMNLQLETSTEVKKVDKMLHNELKIVQNVTETISESTQKSKVEENYLDFRLENYTEHLYELTTLSPEFQTTIHRSFLQNSDKSLNQTSNLNLERPMTENEKITSDGLIATTVPMQNNKTVTPSDNSAATTTTAAGVMQLPELIMTTSSPNIAENLAIAMQKLQKLVHIKNSTEIPPKKQSSVVSNEIIAPSIRTGTEKKAKFINDNSTHQLNLLNTSEVRTLLAMKTIPAKPVVSENKTQQLQMSSERNKNISAMASSNSEKNLLDWTQIMMNENLNNTKIDNLQNSGSHNNSVTFGTEVKPYSKLTHAVTTTMKPVNINSTTTDAVENDITTTANIVDEIKTASTDLTTSLAAATTNQTPTTTDLSADLVETTAETTTNLLSFSDSTNTTSLPTTSMEIKTSSTTPTSEQQSTQPVLVDTTTTANIPTNSIVFNEFLSTTTNPTSLPPTTLMSTTMLSSSFPHDNENKAISSDRNSQTTTENTASSDTTTQLSSDLTSPAQETSDIIMENTTNTAKTTQATAIKSVLDTPKNLSTTFIEATTTTTATTAKHILSSTRQPLPENNLITHQPPPSPPPPSASINDNNYEVTVKKNHHNNESYDERANAQLVVGEEATFELSTSSGTTVSISEASAVNTTALAESDSLEIETTTSAATTTKTTIELTTFTPSISVWENKTSNSTAYANQRVNDVDSCTSITTTTTEHFPTSSSTLETILKVDIGKKNTTTSFEEDFSIATTSATLGGVSQQTTTESLSNFVETTTPTTSTTITTTVYEDSVVFRNHSIHSDFKEEASTQVPNNSIDMNLIDQPENSEKFKQNTANNLNTLVVSEAVDDVELASTIPPTSGTLSTTTERLLISLLDDSTPSTISSSPSTSNEVYEVIATEVPTKPTTATTTTTTAINESTEPPISSVPDLKKIAAPSIPTTMLPITLETVNSAGIGGSNLHPDAIEPHEMDVNVIIAISISVIGIIALILLVAFLYVVRKRQKQMSYGHRCRPVSLDAYSMDNVSVYNSVRRKGAMRSSKRSYGNVAFDDPSLTHNILNASELSKFIERRSTVFDEFKYVPQIIARPDEVPAGCEDKNRYANVIPIPETRVSLLRQNDDEKSEYINANYVRGPRDSPNYYIACQAPLESTVADFWRMIWEQKSRVIIQATDLVENGIEKCAEYLPPSVTLDNHTTYSDFQVTLKHREVKDKYAISTLILKNTLVNSSRELTHYWYKWPETGVPNEEAPIIAMLLEARCSLKSYAVEEANELKATINSKSDIVATLKQDGKDTLSTSSQDNHSVNKTETGNTTQTSVVNNDTNSSSDKLCRNAANSQGPLTVHCSPGTGRTGTIIGCDIAIRSLETPKRNVDIPQVVYYVRRGRASAVQTKEQYEFIYKIANMYASKITNVSNET